MLTWQSSEINWERSTSQNEETKNFVFIDFILFEIDDEDVNIHGENKSFQKGKKVQTFKISDFHFHDA